MVLSTVITSEEVNYLIYRYLSEAGFIHSAFTFGQESFVSQSDIRPSDVPPGLLISVLQRGLQYSALEHHINENGIERKCSKPFNLVQVHVCEEEEKDTSGAIFDAQSSPESVGNEITQSVDGPIQSSLSTLNLALQNASIMATNAVYGATSTAPTSSKASANTVTPSSASASSNNNTTTNTTTTTTTAQSSNGPSTNKKKKSKESTRDIISSNVPISSLSGDVDMKDSSVLEIKTEDIESTNSTEFAEEEIIELIGHHSEVIGCAWNPEKKNLLASASGDSTVRYWTFPGSPSGLYEVNPRTVNKNVKVLEHVLIKDTERSSDVTCLEWRKDGGVLATGCYDGKARIWTAQGDLQRTLQKHTGPIFAVRWNLNGRFLLTTGIDGLAIIWDVEGGGVKHLLQHHSSACLDADWRNEIEFATSGSDKSILFYDMSMAPAEGTGEPFNPSCTLSGHTDEVNTVKFDPSGMLLATCSDDSTVRLWSVEKDATTSEWQGRCLQVLTAHEKEVYTLKWNPVVGSGMFASASFDCSVRIWRISSDGGSEVTSMALNRHTQPVYAIAFSPCGKYLASGSLDESLLIWDVKTGNVLKSYSATGQGGIFDLEWKDNWLAAGNSRGRVIIFEFNPETENGAENKMIDEPVPVPVPARIDDPIVSDEQNEPTETQLEDTAMID